MADKPTKEHKFTVKQQRFIDFYDGNATEAARKAGYKGNDNTLKQVGSENLAKPYISSAIKNREEKRSKSTIMSREERQEFWTKMALNSKKKDSDRLKASELLGRSEADFTDNQRHTGPDGKDLNWKIEIIRAKEQ